MWIGSLDGLFRVKGGKSTRYTTADGLSSNAVRSITQDPDGVMWIGMTNGLVKYAHGVFTAYRFEALGPAPELLTFLKDREGSVWVGSRRLGLARLRASHFSSYSTQNGLPDEYVASVFQHSSGTMWVGTRKGLAVFRDGHFQPFIERSGLPATVVSSIAEDREGHLWVGTDRGLFRSTRPPSCAAPTCDVQFTQLKSDEILDRYIRVVFADRAGTIWVGHRSRRADRLREHRFVKFTTGNGLSSNAVRAIQEDRDGALWIGTRGGGLDRLEDGRFTAYTTKDGLPNNSVQALFMDSEDVLWIGTRQGLSRLKNGKFTTYTVTDGLFSSFVHSIVEDDDRNLWMTCSRGVFRVKKQELTDFAGGKDQQGRVLSLRSSRTDCEHGRRRGPSSGRIQSGRRIHLVRHDGRPERRRPAEALAQFAAAAGAHRRRLHRSSGSSGRMQVAEAAPGRGDLALRYTALSFVAPEAVRFKYKLDRVRS